MRNSITSPLTTDLDLFQIADLCESYAAELVECYDDAYRVALCGRLACCLDVLACELDNPLPSHLIERLTVDTLPAERQETTPDSDLICENSHALTQALLTCALTPTVTRQLCGLLFDQITMLVEDLKAPRFARGGEYA